MKIKPAKWDSNKKVATFLAPKNLPVKTFTVTFKAEQTPDEVYLSPEQRNSFYNKRTELKKLCNRLKNGDDAHLLSKVTGKQIQQRPDVRQLVKRLTGRLGWPLLATVLSSGESSMLADDGTAKSNSPNWAINTGDNEGMSQDLSPLSEQVSLADGNVSQELVEPLTLESVTNDNVSEGADKSLKPIPVSVANALPLLGARSEQAPASVDKVSETLGEPLHESLKYESALDDNISEKVSIPIEQVSVSANQVTEEADEPSDEFIEQEPTLSDEASKESGGQLESALAFGGRSSKLIGPLNSPLESVLELGNQVPEEPGREPQLIFNKESPISEESNELLKNTCPDSKVSNDMAGNSLGQFPIFDDQKSDDEGSSKQQRDFPPNRGAKNLRDSQLDAVPITPVSPEVPDVPPLTKKEKSQPIIKDDLIDFGTQDEDIILEVSVTRNASFENYVGFYKVVDDQLRVRD
ncbi:MAG: hypothetical protein F6K11_18835, partial [Leptolyngbya sp. SIO3F4]|nr:hypothetical protein [Leptolyngbya sp. SIO3F4]